MTRLYNADYYNDVSIHYKLIQAFTEYRQAMRNYCIHSRAWILQTDTIVEPAKPRLVENRAKAGPAIPRDL